MTPPTDDPYENQDWDRIRARLVAYARRRLGRGARVEDAEDLAMRALNQVLDPEYRKWNPNECTLLWHLQSEVNGLISNLRRTKSWSYEDLVDMTDEVHAKKWLTDDLIIARVGSGQILEAVLVVALDRGDELAQQLLLEAADGIVTAKDAAEKLSKPIGLVNEARRRLRSYYQLVLSREEVSDDGQAQKH